MSKYAYQFGAMSLVMAITAATLWSRPVAFIGLLWIAATFAFVAVTYAAGPSLLMKRVDGSRPILMRVLLLPYLLLARISFFLYLATAARSQRPFAGVVPGLWFARRLTAREIKRSGVEWFGILDLAAEFPPVAAKTQVYRSLPMLDGTPPTPTQLRDAINWIDEQIRHGSLLVHCALGHGRTGSVVVSWLVLHGHARDVRSAIDMLTTMRRGFGMSPAQVRAVERFLASESKVS